jgi:hypothetical protein
LSHSDGEITFWGLDEEMIVVLHEAVSVTEPVVALIYLVQKIQESLPILIISEDSPLFIPSIDEMIDGSWILDAEWSCHG